MTSARRLHAMFAPASVAVVGASDDPTRIGGRVLRYLLQHGFPGDVLPVSRSSATVQGLPALRSAAQVPPVDLAVLAVNHADTLTVLDQMLAAGTRNFVSLAAGLDQADVRRVLSPYPDASLVGPNSNGIWSVRSRLVASFGSEANRAELIDGPVAVVAHSGSLGGAIARRLQDERIGLRYLVSAGNEADLDMADYVAFFLDDPQVTTIATYVEGLRDGKRVLGLLRQAAASGIQVVVQLAGISPSARAATASHTGKSLSSADLYVKLLSDAGALVVSTTEALVEACRAAQIVDRPADPRPGVIGISGGMIAIIADSCDRAGLQLAPIGEETARRLTELLPAFTGATNPVDVTGAALERPDILPGCAVAVGSDAAVDTVVVGLDNLGYQRVLDGDWLVRVAEEVKKPIIVVLWDRPLARDLVRERELLAAGVIVVNDPAEVGDYARWASRTNQIAVRPAEPDVPSDPEDAFTHEELTTWAGQVRLAGRLGLRVPTTQVLPREAGESPDLDAPCVVKPLANRVQHKTDRGLVRVGLVGADAVRAAIDEVAGSVAADVPVVVQQKVAGTEVLLSAVTDPDLGPILNIGLGGQLVELLHDVVSLEIPADEAAIRAALGATIAGTVLDGYRGAPAGDVDTLVGAALALQRVLTASPLLEIELNPVMVGHAGSGAYLVDLLTSASSVVREDH